MLKAPIVPGEVRRAFTAGLGDFVSSGSPLWSLLLNKYNPVPAYDLDLKIFWELASPPGFEGRKTLPGERLQCRWRFLAADGGLYAGCHVGSVVQGQPPKLTGLSDSVQILEAMERFIELPSVSLPSPGDFEIRVLRIPWLHFEAFWLYWLPPGNGSTPTLLPPADARETTDDSSRGTDVIVPYLGFVERPSREKLSTMNALVLPEFLQAILNDAQDVQDQSVKHHARVREAGVKQARAHAMAEMARANAVLKHLDSNQDVKSSKG
jgi:hypothetical protein